MKKKVLIWVLAAVLVLSMAGCAAGAVSSNDKYVGMEPVAAAEAAAAETKDTTSISDLIRVPFGYLLDWLYTFTNSYGLALILFSLIAILIGGMGIFAFAIFMVESKTREIALRKVNGASERQIMLLFNRQFMTKVLVACVIGLPIAYYASRKWLENYAYRIEIQPWIFVLTIVISLCIVLLVTNWQIRQASRNNPIDTLKTE